MRTSDKHINTNVCLCDADAWKPIRYDRYMSLIFRRVTPWILLAGDVLALLLFVFIGERNHNIADPQPVLRWLLTTGEFVLPWIIAAAILGAYPGDDAISLRALFLRSLNAWLIALPFALVLRALVLGSDAIPVDFMIVALTVGGAFVLGWRLLFALVWRYVANRRMPTQLHR